VDPSKRSPRGERIRRDHDWSAGTRITPSTRVGAGRDRGIIRTSCLRCPSTRGPTARSVAHVGRTACATGSHPAHLLGDPGWRTAFPSEQLTSSPRIPSPTYRQMRASCRRDASARPIPALEPGAEAIVGDTANSEPIGRLCRRRCDRTTRGVATRKAIVQHVRSAGVPDWAERTSGSSRSGVAACSP
jgi:hypothetical protein